MCKIKFGTDGWRAVMCEDFVLPNVKVVVRAIAEYVKSTGLSDRGIVIGYDTRFFSDRFAEWSARILAFSGIKSYLSAEDVPTPVTAFTIRHLNAAGGIMFTASHNPYYYNGIKFIPDNAAPATPEVTKKIEELVGKFTGKEIEALSMEEAESRGLIKKSCFASPYLEHLKKIIDFEKISSAQLDVWYDPMYATGRRYAPVLLGEYTNFNSLHMNRDLLFGEGMPEPVERELVELIARVKQGADMGLANDGDADRFGIIDDLGEYLSPNMFLPMALLHLIENRGMKGPVTRTIATTHLIDRIAKKYGLPVIETPVGFKYIGNNMLDHGCIMGGEESGGMSIKGHLPEKDGILAISLAAEVRAYYGRPLSEIWRDIGERFGDAHSKRIDLHCDDEMKLHLFKYLKESAPSDVLGKKIVNVNEIDGVKWELDDGSWMLFRASGTEPLVRIYIEAGSRELMDKVGEAAMKIFSENTVPV
ncbi:MAG: phosphoglucomutase/phosphomannomutase family protein [Chloroflexi bacterium]|nr:phosphoglucomutase/phosphomannomutase family protein [Chloroflexota bacterium]